MASYTSDTKLLVELPDSLPSTLSSTVRAQYISDASAEVDSRVGRRYGLAYKSNVQKFPDITDSPATPELIEQAARWLAASRCYRKLGEINRDPNVENIGDKLRREALEILTDIREGKIDVFVSGEDLASAEPLLYSTMEDIDLDFTRGNYQNGTLVSDESGTLDEF